MSGGALEHASGEGGSIYALDLAAGQVHVFIYEGQGLGVGLPWGLAITAELGIMSATTIGEFSGPGFSTNGVAAAGPGISGSIFGNAKGKKKRVKSSFIRFSG